MKHEPDFRPRRQPTVFEVSPQPIAWAPALSCIRQDVDSAAAKARIDSFRLGLAREVATDGMRVNGVRPGIIDTDIHASGGQPDRVRQSAPMVPMPRAGSAEEVA